MKKHIKNKKALGAIVIGAAVLSVGSVGFASWVISGGDTNKDQEVLGIQAATVSDNRITLSNIYFGADDICVGGTDNKSDKTLVDNLTTPTKAFLVFGPTSGSTTGPIQASGNGQSDLEHLSVKFKFDVTSANLVNELDSITIKPTFPTVLTTMASDDYKYIVNPTAGNEADGVVTLYKASGTGDYTGQASWSQGYPNLSNPAYSVSISALSGTTATVTLTINWKWGAAFGGKNPAAYAAENPTKVNDIVTALTDIHTKVGANTENIKFTISATAKTAQAA